MVHVKALLLQDESRNQAVKWTGWFLLCSQISLWPVCLPTGAGGSMLAAQYCSVAAVVLRGVGCGPGSAHWGDGRFLEKTVGFPYASISISIESSWLRCPVSGVLGSQIAPVTRAVLYVLRCVSDPWLIDSSMFFCFFFPLSPSFDKPFEMSCFCLKPQKFPNRVN